MKLTKAVTRGVALTGIIASVGALTTVPAQAATGFARCPADRFCVFTGVNGSGVMGYFTQADSNLGDSVGPRGLNNNIESVWNRRRSEWGLYNDTGYTGGITLILVGSKSNIAARYRNITSSLMDIRS